MSNWNVTLPGAKAEGDPGHVSDHNVITDALVEIRSNVDAVEATVAEKQDAGSYAAATHTHNASDTNAGTFNEDRIPSLPISKTTGLQAALDGKQDSGNYAAASHTHAAADTSSGTFDVERIPNVPMAKVTGLEAALNGKQSKGSYATAAALADLVTRVEALEAGAGG